jgi:hypothetical protein
MRPENHVPICKGCAQKLSWGTDQDLEIALGYAYWGSMRIPVKSSTDSGHAVQVRSEATLVMA